MTDLRGQRWWIRLLRMLNWWERIRHRRDHRMSPHWIATWEQHEREIAGHWREDR